MPHRGAPRKPVLLVAARWLVGCDQGLPGSVSFSVDRRGWYPLRPKFYDPTMVLRTNHTHDESWKSHRQFSEWKWGQQKKPTSPSASTNWPANSPTTLPKGRTSVCIPFYKQENSGPSKSARLCAPFILPLCPKDQQPGWWGDQQAG